jgi:hypothetical protein
MQLYLMIWKKTITVHLFYTKQQAISGDDGKQRTPQSIDAIVKEFLPGEFP